MSNTLPNSGSVILLSFVGNSFDVLFTSSVALVVSSRTIVNFDTISVTAAADVFSKTVVVVGPAVLGTSTFIVALIRGSVKTVLPSVVTSTATGVVLASLLIDVVDVFVGSATGIAFVRGSVVSVTDSVYTSCLTSVVTVEASVATCASSMTSTGTAGVVSVVAAIVAFVVSTTFVSAVALAVACRSISIFTGETVLCVTFSVMAALEVSSTTMSVVGLALLGCSTFAVVVSIRDSVETASATLTAVVTGTSVVTPIVTSAVVAVISPSAAAGIAEASLVSTASAAVVSGIAVLVTDSVDTTVLATAVTVETSVATFVSTLTSNGSEVMVSVTAAVPAFVVSTTSLSLVAWAVMGRSTSMFSFSLALVGCTGEAVLPVAFSVTAAVEISSIMATVVGLAVLATSTFAVASLIASIETASISLAVDLT